MPDLNFQVVGAEPQRFAAAPMLLFKLRVAEPMAAGAEPTPIHSVALAARSASNPPAVATTPTEQQRLLDLFGTPERWGQTLAADALDARQYRRTRRLRYRRSWTCRCLAASISTWRPRSTSPP